MSPTFVTLFFAVIVTAAAYTSFPYYLRRHGEECGPDGSWNICVSKCEPKCSNDYKVVPDYCREECRQGCRCKENYVIDDLSGYCVAREMCSKSIKKKKSPSISKTSEHSKQYEK